MDVPYQLLDQRAAGWQAVTMYKRLPGGHAVLAGNAGEVARAYYWNDSDTESGTITPARLLAYCGCPVDGATTQRARDWLDGVPTDNALEILDLFMIEQDMGCWASVIQYAECDPGFAIFPRSPADRRADARVAGTVSARGASPAQAHHRARVAVAARLADQSTRWYDAVRVQGEEGDQEGEAPAR
ncbi:MAG: hypothetical protein U1E63_02110 [Burkholderiales bacterium]